MKPNRLLAAILCLLVSASTLHAADPASQTLPLKDRVAMASRLYADIQAYFAHWQAIPAFNLDDAYSAYLDQVLSTGDRKSFDLATLALFAKLQNGHSGFSDRWLQQTYGQALNFYAYPIDGQWVVVRSKLPELKVGDTIATVDGQPFQQFYEGQRQYISGSNERWRQRSFFEYPYLFPQHFQLVLGDGRHVAIQRNGPFQYAGMDNTKVDITGRNGVLILKIPGFEPSSLEAETISALKQAASPKAIILDVRGNHGGTTPRQLIAALMDRPYRWWSESTPATVGTLQLRNDPGTHTELHWFAGVEQSTTNLYKGPLFILTDGGCFSACEDFLVAFKDNHRATILGEQTGGSSGQPYQHRFNQDMAFALSTKREFMPDGSPFEGVGIAPDIEVHLTAEDLAAGHDPALDKAISLTALIK